MIPQITETGQEKLKEARVLIAGAGGIGSPVAFYLAAAGVGTLRIVDRDRVELSNLNRQISHWSDDVGRIKADSLREKLRKLNPDVEVEALCQTIAAGNVRALVSGCDLIVDALDNMTTRYLLNQMAIECGIPFLHGAVAGFEGRAMTVIPGKTACLRCLYRGPVPETKVPVLGASAAVIGAVLATEAIKFLTGKGELLGNRLLVYDGLNLRFTEFRLKRNPGCEHCARL